MAQAGLKACAAVVSLTVLTLCGCVEGADKPIAAAGQPALRVFPGSLLLPAPGPPGTHLPDMCGAAALAGLVGRPRSQIPVPVDLSRRRVACTACPVAPDIRLDRVNILFDAKTGLVTRIACG